MTINDAKLMTTNETRRAKDNEAKTKEQIIKIKNKTHEPYC